jgi:peptidoglycan biosynthesis protein MviN/MurJ (putative lipid II flippase)
MVAITNFFFLYSMMRHYVGRLETGLMLLTIGKLLLAGAALAGICWLAFAFFFSTHAHAAAWQNAIIMMITVAGGAGTFFGAAYLLRVAEVHDIAELVRRRLRPQDLS